MGSTRSVHRLPAISRGFVTATGLNNPLARRSVVGTGCGGDDAAVGVDVGGGGSGTTDVAGTGVIEAGRGGSRGEKRVLLGVGTYLIDTPKDTGLQLRERFFTYQEQHRGLSKSQDETFPEIPFRFNPKPEEPDPTAMTRRRSVMMVDVATSPMMPCDGEESNSSRAATPAPRTVTFATDICSEGTSRSQNATGTRTAATSTNAKDDVKTTAATNARDDVRNASQDTPSIAPLAVARSVSFSERPRKKTPPRRPVRECSKLRLYSREGTNPSESPRDLSQPPPPLLVPTATTHSMERLPVLPDTARTAQSMDSARRKSASVSDLTDVGSIFSWHDQEFDLRTCGSVDVGSDNVGPTSYFQRSKSKSLLDLLKLSWTGGMGMGGDVDGDPGKPNELTAANYHKKQRTAQLAFRRNNSFSRRSNAALSDEAADREWLDMVNTQVVDTDYDKFASRRKPNTPAASKKPTNGGGNRPFTPRGGKDFKISQPDSGKVYPVFFTDGTPVRKFGHATNNRRKTLKSRSK